LTLAGDGCAGRPGPEPGPCGPLNRNFRAACKKRSARDITGWTVSAEAIPDPRSWILDDLDAIERFTGLYDRYRSRVYAYAVSRAGR
jgi:hypothetical protein